MGNSKDITLNSVQKIIDYFRKEGRCSAQTHDIFRACEGHVAISSSNLNAEAGRRLTHLLDRNQSLLGISRISPVITTDEDGNSQESENWAIWHF